MKLSEHIEYTKAKCQVCKRDKKESIKMIAANKKLIEYIKLKIVKAFKLSVVCKTCISKDEKELRQKLLSSV